MGGPGGSGVDFVRGFSGSISQLVDGRYDIVGFDPRGTGRSNTIRCFKDGADNQLFSANLRFSLGPGENAANFAIAHEALVNKCLGKNKDFLPYVSTAAVARDIDSLREAFGQELTNYFGLSYGTYLGATYGNMFPDRVGRVVLDGVIDPTTYTGDIIEWITTSITHTEEGFEKFGSACEAAGAEKCALAHPDKALAHNDEHYVTPTVRKFLENLTNHPVLASNQSIQAYVTQSDVANVIFQGLYYPNQWATIAQGLADAIYHGDGNTLANLTIQNQQTMPGDHGSQCPSEETYSLGPDPVLCIDGNHDKHPDLESWMRGVDDARKVSPLAGPIFVTSSIDCLYWNVTAAERYTGPWNQQTKNKVLIIGTTGDPVTPIENAEKLEKLMEGNGVFFKHEGWGHTSVTQPSNCTRAAIAKYFFNGTLPENGSGCPVEVEPFVNSWSLKLGTTFADMEWRTMLNMA